jgi:alpha-D-ribose 1-methylphosphonate 5-triphosphate diphosphatase
MQQLWMAGDSRSVGVDVTLRNARLVLKDGVVEGDLALAGGRIVEAPSAASTDLDCQGDYVLPGLIDIHTDNVEHHMQPRPGVRWPSPVAAMLAHDWQLLGSGITTVLDALSMGDYDSGGKRSQMLSAAIEAVGSAHAAGLLKVDHYFHFRCELSDAGLPALVEQHIDNPLLRLVSMMDHTPGQRQWHDIALYRAFRRKKNNNVWSDAEFEVYLAGRLEQQARHVGPARELIGRLATERRLPLASHDDTTVGDVEEAHRDGITISEFPTTLAAAQRARDLGLKVVMGAPNLVLGGSHSGNVGAMPLAEAGLLDVLTSDYVPGSLLHAAFLLAQATGDLPAAISTVTAIPAAMLGLVDRGLIEPGRRADLLRVAMVDGLPVIRGAWVAGRRHM